MHEANEIIALKNGCDKAFESIYKRYSGKLYNFIMSLSQGNQYMAEEVVQTTFVKLWETRKQVDPEKNILPYLSTIAKNMLMNKYQRQMVEYLYQAYVQNEQTELCMATEKEIDRKSFEQYVDELIEKLPPSRKQIIKLSKKEDLSTKQIAEKLQLSVSTVETQLSLAVKFLRKQLQQNYDKVLWLLFLVN